MCEYEGKLKSFYYNLCYCQNYQDICVFVWYYKTSNSCEIICFYLVKVTKPMSRQNLWLWTVRQVVVHLQLINT